MRNLRELLIAQGADLTGWESGLGQTAISADGRTIIGTGFNTTSGQFQSWLARIDLPAQAVVPEPSAWALLALGALPLAGYAWRQRGFMGML